MSKYDDQRMEWGALFMSIHPILKYLCWNGGFEWPERIEWLWMFSTLRICSLGSHPEFRGINRELRSCFLRSRPFEPFRHQKSNKRFVQSATFVGHFFWIVTLLKFRLLDWKGQPSKISWKEPLQHHLEFHQNHQTSCWWLWNIPTCHNHTLLHVYTYNIEQMVLDNCTHTQITHT